jgi:hypothetical protein
VNYDISQRLYKLSTMARKKKAKKPQTHRTNIKILEVTRDSGLTELQRRLLDKSEHAIIQYPYMDDRIQALNHLVRNRMIKLSELPTDLDTTQKHILQSLYKRKKKPTYISGITEEAYKQHTQDTLNQYNQELLEAEDHFYCTDLEQTIQSAKQAFEHLVRHKQGLERNIIGELFDITEKITETDPADICYIIQAENPQVADSLTRWYNDLPETNSHTFSPFSLDFPTQLYRDFTRGKFKNPDYELQDIEYLKLTLHTILLNLSINEGDIESGDFRMQQPWLNKTRNAIINSIDYEDVLGIREVANQKTYCSDKSVVYIQEFKKRFPKIKSAAHTTATRYLYTGFNNNLPK